MPSGREGRRLSGPADDREIGAAAASGGSAGRDQPDAGLWTVANIVSLLRLAAVPVFLWILLGRDDLVLAAWVMVAIGLTDWLDGSLARALGQVSEIGKFLDPLADRVAILAAVVGGMIAGVVPLLISVPLLVREAVVALGALYVVRRVGKNLEVRYLGKVATFIVYGAVPSFYLDAAGVEAFRVIGWVTGIVGLVLYYAVTVEYGRDVVAQVRRDSGTK